MLKAFVVALCLNSALAVPPGGGYLSGGLGYGAAGYGGLGSGLGYGLGGGLASGYATGLAHGPLQAAVVSRRTYDVVPVPTHSEPAQLTQIEVDPIESPVAIRFVSKSSPVLIDQVHLPGEPGKLIETHSEDEAHRLIHTVSRPVIQEVREVIQPYRRIEQEVRPVVEEVNTVVARGTPRIQSIVAPVAEPVALAAPVLADHGVLDGGLGLAGAAGLGLAGGLSGGLTGVKGYSKLGYSK